MVLLEYDFCASTVSPANLLKVLKPRDWFCLVERAPRPSRDLEHYASWQRIAQSDCFSISIAPGIKQPLLDALAAIQRGLSSQHERLMSTADGSSSGGVALWQPQAVRPSIQHLVAALESIKCTAVRLQALVSFHTQSKEDLARLDVCDRLDTIWVFRIYVLTREITLVRSGPDTPAQTLPSLGAFGRGFGLVDLPLSSRSDGVYRLRITQGLSDVLAYREVESGSAILIERIDSECLFDTAIRRAINWQEELEDNLPCKLSRTIIEAYVEAKTEDEARDALAASRLLNWPRLIQGQETGVPLEVCTVHPTAYRAHFGQALATALGAQRQMGRFDNAEATRILLQLYEEIGYVDPYKFPSKANLLASRNA
ncbi:uncharacterized protein PSFLO_07241 [Pseudozyma flocculosa]|uniref:Uncharacterized protein n=1 Tax=Pseudozyma flocculosa TaxID=84751 RepID=A0A5C3FEG6_9BASI|nr:uncharacterized protein PSFLO_07241 [Pseudozyma flocculosa]